MIEIFEGDCLTVMDRLAPGYFDIVLTDPPYLVMPAGQERHASGKWYMPSMRGAADISFPHIETPETAPEVFFESWMKKALFLTRPSGLILSFIDWRGLPMASLAMEKAGWTRRGILTWEKFRGISNKGRFLRNCEFILWGTRGDRPICVDDGFFDPSGQPMPPCVFRTTAKPPIDRPHPMEKPAPVIDWLLSIVKEGDTARILDPFCGGGSTLRGAYRRGFDAVGIEKSPHYFKILEKEMADMRKGEQLDLKNLK